jgi:hypothetical protein
MSAFKLSTSVCGKEKKREQTDWTQPLWKAAVAYFVAAGLHGLLWFGRAGCGGPCFVDLYLVY